MIFLKILFFENNLRAEESGVRGFRTQLQRIEFSCIRYGGENVHKFHLEHIAMVMMMMTMMMMTIMMMTMMMMTMKMVMMMISPPGQNKDIVFNEGGVEPEVERTLLVVLWHLLRSIRLKKKLQRKGDKNGFWSTKNGHFS